MSLSAIGNLNLGNTTPVSLNVVTLTLVSQASLTWSGGTLAAGNTASDASVTLSAEARFTSRGVWKSIGRAAPRMAG